MSHADLIARMGAFMGVLTFVHFAVDFVLQTHAEAMAKHADWKIRARHCLIYTVPFLPLLAWIGVPTERVIVSGLVLFLSHFGEDTYLPVFFWAKYVRRVPQMQWKALEAGRGGFHVSGPTEFVGRMSVRGDLGAPSKRETLIMEATVRGASRRELQVELDQLGFREFIDTPLGKILMIAIDQIVHIAFLLPVAYFAATVH